MIAHRSMRALAVAATGLVALASGICPSARAGQGANSRPVSTQGSVPGASQLTDLESALRVAARTLREAVGDEAQEAKGQLLALIGNYFDADLVGRRRQLAGIEFRLTNLKGELDRRQAAKGEVINVQLKAMEKDDVGRGRYSREQMSTLLANFFDADMKNRQRELADMEGRVQKLNIQVEKRQAARDEIIQLQLNVLVNEAAGLGFYSQPKGNGL